MSYVLVSGMTGTIELIDDSCIILDVPDSFEPPENLRDLERQAERNRWSTIDLLELIEQMKYVDDSLPDFDLVESLGFDGTQREDGPVTWEQVARKLLEEREEKKPTVELGENAAFYVRCMVNRGLASIRNDIDAGKEYLEHDAPGSILGSVRGMVAYNEQMLREAEQFVPESLR